MWSFKFRLFKKILYMVLGVEFMSINNYIENEIKNGYINIDLKVIRVKGCYLWSISKKLGR